MTGGTHIIVEVAPASFDRRSRCPSPWLLQPVVYVAWTSTTRNAGEGEGS